LITILEKILRGIHEVSFQELPIGFHPNDMYSYKDSNSDKYTLTLDPTNISENSVNGSYLKTGEGEDGDSSTIEAPDINISTEPMDCSKLLGSNLLSVLKLCISALRIAGAIIVLVKASLAMIPAIQSGDDAAIKKAAKQCISLAIILLVIGVFPTIIRIIGLIAGFDLSCL